MKDNKMCGIYKITNMANGKVYIGQSIDIVQRWYCHKSASKNNDEILYRAMRKYGLENFSFEILMECEEELLDLMEIYYIKMYNSYIGWKNNNGYNMNEGGSKAGGVKGFLHFRSMNVICDSKLYANVSECAIFYNENEATMRSWLNGGASMPIKYEKLGLRYSDGHTDDIIIYQNEEYFKQVKQNRINSHKGKVSPKTNKVFCDDIIFKTYKECAIYLNMNKDTLRGILEGRDNMPIELYERGLRREDKQMTDYKIAKRKLNTEIICEETLFKSIKACADYYNYSPTLLSVILRKEIPIPKIWYDRKLRYSNICFEEMDYVLRIEDKSKGNSPFAKRVICENIIFDCVEDCADYYNIPYTTMINWLNHTNNMPIKWYIMGLRYEDEPIENYKISFHNKAIKGKNVVFYSIKECAEYYNESPSTMSKWLSGKNKMPQKYINLELHYMTEEEIKILNKKG